MTDRQTTLKEIFKRYGMDPFDAFMLPKHEWPQEAQDLVNDQKREDTDKIIEQNLSHVAEAEAWDRYQEPNN